MKKEHLFFSVLALCTICSCGKENNKGNNTIVLDVDKSWKESGYEGNDYRYLCNGNVQIGIDLSSGGSVFHFSESKTKKNLLNHFDQGRFVQQSYYDGKMDGSDWNGKPWRWNPIQGGGWNGVKSRILSKDLKKDKLIVVTEPVHWATCKALPECEMKETITLGENYAKIHYEFTNNGKGATAHATYDQELPAVFCDHALPYFVSYTGDKPWTDAPVTIIKEVTPVETWPFTQALSSECWAAFVNDKDWGIGVYTPNSTGTQGLDEAGNIGKVRYSAYRANYTGDGPVGSSCSYFAPHAKKTITKGWSFGYDVYITIGTIQEIRATFKKIHDGK